MKPETPRCFGLALNHPVKNPKGFLVWFKPMLNPLKPRFKPNPKGFRASFNEGFKNGFKKLFKGG